MLFDKALTEEINLLMKFPDSSMEGLKVHHSAEQWMIDTVKRLHDKGLTSQDDGGYLTDLGKEALETATLLYGLVSPSS